MGTEVDKLESHGFEDRTELAQMRTGMAAERTVFATIRTGLSIAGGGSLVITLLAAHWPKWVQVPLVIAFLGTGYTMALMGLERYRGFAHSPELKSSSKRERIRVHIVTSTLIVLQITIVIVIVLFLLSGFNDGRLGRAAS